MGQQPGANKTADGSMGGDAGASAGDAGAGASADSNKAASWCGPDDAVVCYAVIGGGVLLICLTAICVRKRESHGVARGRCYGVVFGAFPGL